MEATGPWPYPISNSLAASLLEPASCFKRKSSGIKTNLPFLVSKKWEAVQTLSTALSLP